VRRAPIALLSTAACAILALPVPASAVPIHRHMERTVLKGGEWPVKTVRWTETVNVAPRDSDEDGLANTKDECPQTAGSVDGCPVVSAPASSLTSATGSSTNAGLASCDFTQESGPSESYTATNPSSGAYGRYQIIPSTAANHDCDLSTPAGQDACAATIMATEGPGAWASSGAC
jgi:hypothetical protein